MFSKCPRESLVECNFYLYIIDLEVAVTDHETRLTVTEENIQGLSEHQSAHFL